MDSFVFLPSYRVVVCRACKYAVLGKEIGRHLKDQHTGVSKQERRRIAGSICEIPGLIKEEKELEGFEFPPPTATAIPELQLHTNGLRCQKCPYVSRQRQGIQEHCRSQHGWHNERKRGRERYSARQESREVPWTTGVHCQRFFRTRCRSGWFEVEREVTETPCEPQDVFSQIRQVTEAGMQRVEKKRRETIKAADENREPNLWLRRVRWIEHLEGKDAPRLLASIESVDRGREVVLQGVCESLDRVIHAAHDTAAPSMVSYAVLFEINRKVRDTKAKKPFDGQMEPGTLQTYQGVWRQTMCYLYRTQDWDDDDRPPYELTREQGDGFDDLVEAVKELQALANGRAADGAVGEEEAAQVKRVDRLCLQLCVRLLDHQLVHTEYDSVIISAMAVMGMREDGGWVNAEDYTPKYSAFIKIARMLVVRLAYVQREEAVANMMRRSRGQVDETTAREKAESVFDIVRRKVHRYMTLVHGDSKPTPMDWIFESRSYGLKIRYTTTAEGVIDWDGDRITYQDKKFTMNQVRDMIHGVASAARRDLMELLMVDADEDGDVDETQVPVIDWEGLEDDHSEERVGWSFLDDIRNRWAVDGRWWLTKRICAEEKLRRAWLREGGGKHPYRRRAVDEYQKNVVRFQEKLLMVMHMVGGQSPRATEILGMRHCNSAKGGFRNILIHRGLVCFVAAYHKNYRSSEQIKVIHRYLPRAVGELLVWYLWLVLPFWQQVQVVVQEANEISPFLWADAIVSRIETRAQRGGHAGGEERGDQPVGEAGVNKEKESGEFDFATMHQSTRWTSARLRGIIQEQSVQWVGEELNISAWRHVSIGISNRFLRGGFKDESVDIDLDNFGDEDDPWDLQAGHGTHVAGMIYARLLRQDRMGTMGRQEKFRQISQRWHRFLGFSEAVEGERKRKWEAFEEEGREMQFQRSERLRRVNIQRRLQVMMGEEARFRGNQEPAIRAIVDGDSPVVQIAGTGGGKSLSFMLPAYCVPGGVTVVVAPLVSLKDDLQRRCEELQIDSTVWESQRPNRVASIIFVTPESVVSKTFSTFINRLKGTYQLDRVVVDECHTVLDSSAKFRPKLQKLGRTLVKMCTQLVFLTATLPPRDEEAFFRAMRIPYHRGQPFPGMFRAPTTRANVRYRVRECRGQAEAEDEVVQATVAGKLAEHGMGKIIVYCSEITRGQRLAEALDCPFYHRHADDRRGKAQRMKDWMEGKHRVMVATNALGLGVDVPDIRVVVHAGAPRRIRDYAQESGRAGRDGAASEAIIVCSRSEGGRKRYGSGWTDVAAVDMPEFIQGHCCRRVIMDRVMDGREDRVRCEEGEEVCDVCEEDERFRGELEAGGWAVEDDIFDDSGVGLDEEPARARFEQRERQRQWAYRQLVVEDQQDGVEVCEFRRQLEQWVGVCPLCHWRGLAEQEHEISECRQAEAMVVCKASRQIREEMRKHRLFQEFSCCVWCGVPQAICEKWQARAEGGLWEEVPGGRCQFEGILIDGFVAMLIGGEEGDEAVFEWMAAEGVEERDQRAICRWLGQRVEWGKVEATRISKVFHYLAGLHERRVD